MPTANYICVGMSIYVPRLKNWAPFYIQRNTDASAIDIQTQYGVTIKVHEYPSKRKVKQPYKVDWKDQHGDDEYCDYLFYEAFKLTLECVILTKEANSSASRQEIKAQIRNFENAIAQGEFKIYDDYTKFGFRKVRIDEFPQIADDGFKNFDGRCRLIFKMVLKVNDPVTNMVMSNGNIVEG